MTRANEQDVQPVPGAAAPATAGNRRRRRRLIVNPAAQRRFILQIALAPLALMAIGGVAAVVLSGNLFAEAARVEGELPSLGIFVWTVFALIVLSGLAIVVQSLLNSHRVAGPAHRVIKSMERIRAGDLEFVVQLREHDQLQDVADELNRLLEWLREQRAARLTADAEQLARSVDP